MTTGSSGIVCFGEILWDILPSGTVPGGAPMNVAYHLHQLNESPALITRVGADERGEELKQILRAKQVDISLLQTDPEHATGLVHGIADDKGDMKYDIVAPSAWDFIRAEEAVKAKVASSAYFIFGSLAARATDSRNTLLSLLKLAHIKILDVNLRAPFYDEELIRELISRADLVKLNNDELQLLADWWKIDGGLAEQAAALQRLFNLEMVIVTRGSNGAAVWQKGQLSEHPGFSVKVADTVGSGDAFLAGFLHCIIQQKPVADALNFACGLGALVASRTGAWPEYTLKDIAALTDQ
jgi:fructokinase